MQYLPLKIIHRKFNLFLFILPTHRTRTAGPYILGYLLSSIIIQLTDDLYILCFFFLWLCGLLPPENEDCCVHCILACLFCEFLTLCNIVLGQASCGICTSEACCCCCGDEMGDDCNCPCDMDCGIMDACCESSDCLEICMECCGICFPS